MIKRILLTLALASAVMAGVAACNNSGGAAAPTISTQSSAPVLTSPEASMPTESSAPSEAVPSSS